MCQHPCGPPTRLRPLRIRARCWSRGSPGAVVRHSDQGGCRRRRRDRCPHNLPRRRRTTRCADHRGSRPVPGPLEAVAQCSQSMGPRDRVAHNGRRASAYGVGMRVLVTGGAGYIGSHTVTQLMFSSSATVYGASAPVPMTEDLPTSATNPYGWTKVMIEQILRDVAVAQPESRIALLRYFNPVGAHASGTIGEDPSDIPNNLVPYIAQVAVGRREKLQIFGDDYDTPDGTPLRDYIHVEDLAAGHIAALSKLATTDSPVSTWNLGTGVGRSVLDVLHAFERAVGRALPYEIVARRAGDIAASYADPHRANAELGWTATRTIDDMCADSWRWQSQNPDGYPDA